MAGVTTVQICVILLFLFSGVEMNILVTSPAGSFQGKTITDIEGRPYAAYRGIPYAKPPVGELRFAKPQPLDKLESVFDATGDGPVCPHVAVFAPLLVGKTVQEDCLNLNIYTPDDSRPHAGKKVMVFIHGGGYVAGTASDFLPGSFVTANDMILVTINYRLGVLGFLSTEDSSSPGNYGLWDMTLALTWLKDNIASFGGDPSDIAISGESAGASAVGHLSLSPAGKGLFSKAYPQSGSATSVFGIDPNPLEDTLRLAREFDCYSGSGSDISESETAEIVNCLRQKPFQDLADFSTFNSLNSAEFVPCVDGDFIPRAPLSLIKDDDYLKSVGFSDRSYLLGINNNEAAIMKLTADIVLSSLRSTPGLTSSQIDGMVGGFVSSVYSHYATYRNNGQTDSDVTAHVRDWYERRFGNETRSLSQISADVSFLLPAFDFMAAAARGENSKVWLFHLDHFPRFMKGEVKGTPHALDLMYYFDLGIEAIDVWVPVGMDVSVGLGEFDIKLREDYRSLIADFCKYGSLTEAPVLQSLGVSHWPEYSPSGEEQEAYLSLQEPISEVKKDFGRDIRSMWARHTGNRKASRHDKL